MDMQIVCRGGAGNLGKFVMQEPGKSVGWTIFAKHSFLQSWEKPLPLLGNGNEIGNALQK